MSEGQKTIQTSDDLPPVLNQLVAAAHELKTPLTVISHLAASLQDQSLGLNDQDRQQIIDRIKLSADRTLNLVQGLTISQRLTGQDLSRLFVLESVNITRECQDIIDELQPLAAQYQQIITLKTVKSYLIVGNVELLRSVLYNLIDNAVRHGTAGARVQVSLKRCKDNIRVSIADQGPGVKKADWKKLKKNLGQQLQPLGSRSGSSGLGLYIAGQLAASMGGNLGVKASSDGATFYVDLLCSKQLSLL